VTVTASWLLAVGLALAAPEWQVALSEGWALLQAGDAAAAAQRYEHAAELRPDSEDAWLGLQLARIVTEEWDEAGRAGDRLLLLNPDNLWAIRRQAWVRYNQGRYPEAQAFYERALDADPADPEMLLGLGATLARQGETERGHALCARAAQALGQEDPRPAECHSIESPDRVRGWASAAAAYTGWIGGAVFDDTLAASASAGAVWPVGIELWAGATWSRTSLGVVAEPFQQVNPVLGLAFAASGMWISAAGSYVFASDPLVDGAGVGVLALGYGADAAEVAAESVVSVYPSGPTVAQTSAWFGWAPASWLELRLGPVLTVVRTDADTELLPSAHMACRAHLPGGWTLEASGHGGLRRYPVEFSGMSVWTGSERTVGGYALGVGWAATRSIELGLSFRHDFGDEQAGERVDFQRVGGSFVSRFAY
jgi:tetratricopeptide (TPR) repeat protein